MGVQSLAEMEGFAAKGYKGRRPCGFFRVCFCHQQLANTKTPQTNHKRTQTTLSTRFYKPTSWVTAAAPLLAPATAAPAALAPTAPTNKLHASTLCLNSGARRAQ